MVSRPARATESLPTKALAEAIAAEAATQGKKKNLALMPLAQLAATAIDIVPKSRASIIDQIAAYAESELLCHRAEEPPELAERQRRLGQPLLDWCAKKFGAALKSGTGLMPIKQSPDALKALRRAIEAYDDFRLAGLQQAVHASGSLILGLALAERHIDAVRAFEVAELDASFQIERWGNDPAAAARHEGVKRDLALCETWFELLRDA